MRCITAAPAVLGLITGVRTGKPEGMSGWWGIRILVVTTADGTEYEFPRDDGKVAGDGSGLGR
jgi:hypothetical protein